MPATLDINAQVNILDAVGAVNRKSFGTPLHATDDVTGGFTENVRFYASNTEAQADADLGTVTKAALATAFSRSRRPKQVAVGKVVYVSLGTSLDAILADSEDFYGVDLASRVQADIEALAVWAEANERIAVPQSSDAALLAGTALNVGENLQGASYKRTGLLYHEDDTEHAAMSWLAGRLAFSPDDFSGIWAYDQLPGITVDSINTTQKNTVVGYNANVYLPFKGQPATWAGTTADGSYFDQRITADWLKARTEERFAQAFLNATARGTKIPYDNDGIGIFRSLLLAQLRDGERLKHLRAGSSSVEELDISDIPEATVQARQLTLNAVTVITGAIQEITANITLLVQL